MPVRRLKQIYIEQENDLIVPTVYGIQLPQRPDKGLNIHAVLQFALRSTKMC
jgi:hypothetical protein